MRPILTQIQAVIATHFSDQFLPASQKMTDELRLTLLQAILPLCAQIPHPSSGNTLQRWQILAYIAGVDLTLVKWLESHLDALSILHELGYANFYQTCPNKLWAVWASEGHATPVTFMANHHQTDKGYEQGHCNGVKAWCSGANRVDFGLMTYRDSQQQSQLMIVNLNNTADTIDIDNQAWQAVGMQATDTATLTFKQTPATHLGGANAYLKRSGFWHGAAGVGACWYGATVAIATYLLRAVQQKPDPFKALYLGQISTQLAVTQQYLYQVAAHIDQSPNDSHELMIRQLRQQVEVSARMVIEQVGLALGATPFCQNAHFARLTADLGVFIRQSHGAFDAQAIGESVAKMDTQQDTVWQL